MCWYLFIDWSQVLGNILNLVGILGGVLLAFWLGLIAFKRQKSIEECRHKYIDEGIEALQSELSEGFASYLKNWQTAVALNRIIRDWDPAIPTPIQTSDIKFDVWEPKNLGLRYCYKVNELLGNDIAQKWSFAFYADLAVFNTLYLEQEFSWNLKNFILTPNKNIEKCKEAYGKYYKTLTEWEQKIGKNLALIDGLGEAIRILRRKQISYETLEKVKEDEQIMKIVKNLNDNFDKIRPPEK